MAGKILPLLFIILSFSANQNFAQTYRNTSLNGFNDWDDWDDSFSYFNDGKPFIELNFGSTKGKHKNFDGDFESGGLLELKLGYVDKDNIREDNILKTSSTYFLGSYMSTDNLGINSTWSGKVHTELWRFGGGYREGFGYGSRKFAVIPYRQCGLTWSRLNFNEIDEDGNIVSIGEHVAQLSENDYEILKRYDEAFRFGKLNEAGVRIEAVDFISLNAAYETSVIFPRHLFWKQTSSFIIELIGLEMIDEFVDEIFDSTPVAAPIVNFILKNGYSFGFYELQRENMSWPFDTETPLTYESFKFGVTFTF